jgi:hypothetical protein
MSNSRVYAASDTPETTLIGEQVTAKEIVVTVGTSAAAADALGRAAKQSLLTGVPLRIVHGWQMTASPSGDAGAAFWVASAADARARATRWGLETLGDSAGTVRWILDIVELPAVNTAAPGGAS